MEANTPKQLVIDKLLALNTKGDKAITIDSLNGNLEITKSKVQDSLDQVSKHVKFYDMEFDNPESSVIRTLSEVRGFTGIPFFCGGLAAAD